MVKLLGVPVPFQLTPHGVQLGACGVQSRIRILQLAGELVHLGLLSGAAHPLQFLPHAGERGTCISEIALRIVETLLPLIYPAGSGLLAGLCLFELCLISLELAGQFLLTFSSRTGSSTVLFHLSFGRSQLGTGLIHLGGPTGLRCLGIFQPGLDLLEFSALGIQGPSQNIRLGGERLNALVVCTIRAVNKGQLRAKSL